MSGQDKCPLCGGNVLYRGAMSLECDSGRDKCKNGSYEITKPDLGLSPWIRCGIPVGHDLNRSGIGYMCAKCGGVYKTSGTGWERYPTSVEACPFINAATPGGILSWLPSAPVRP